MTPPLDTNAIFDCLRARIHPNAVLTILPIRRGIGANGHTVQIEHNGKVNAHIITQRPDGAWNIRSHTPLQAHPADTLHVTPHDPAHTLPGRIANIILRHLADTKGATTP